MEITTATSNSDYIAKSALGIAANKFVISVGIDNPIQKQWASNYGCILRWRSYYEPISLGNLDQFMKPAVEVKTNTQKKLSVAEFEKLITVQFGMFKDQKEYMEDWLGELRNESESRLNDLYVQDLG